MIHIVVALACEAKPLIEKLQLKQTRQSPFEIYENQNVKLIVSGFGHLNALSSVMHLGTLSKASLWFNVGVVGNKSAEIGDLFLVSKVSHKDFSKSFYPYTSLKHTLKRSSLKTVPYPTQDYQEEWLYDMEAYGFYFGALKFTNIEKIYSLKVISDNQHTNLKDITKKYVTDLIQNQIDSILKFIEMAKSKVYSFPIHNEYDLFENHFKFSQTEKLKLKKLLDLLSLHEKSPPSFDEYAFLENSKAVLKDLEKRLSNIEVEND